MLTRAQEAETEDWQRFIQLGKLSASLIHEISSPLTAAMLHLEQMSDQTSLSSKAIKRSLNRLSRYVNAARSQLKNQSPYISFYYDSQLREVRRLMQPLAKLAGVQLTFQGTSHIKLLGDPVKFQQILVNLIVNAIEAYDPNTVSSQKRVLVKTKLYGRSLQVAIYDWGSGISQENLEKVFQPFYTTKNKDKDLGLGLTIVKSLVENDFGGTINIVSKYKIGTRFIVKFPLPKLLVT